MLEHIRAALSRTSEKHLPVFVVPPSSPQRQTPAVRGRFATFRQWPVLCQPGSLVGREYTSSS